MDGGCGTTFIPIHATTEKLGASTALNGNKDMRRRREPGDFSASSFAPLLRSSIRTDLKRPVHQLTLGNPTCPNQSKLRNSCNLYETKYCKRCFISVHEYISSYTMYLILHKNRDVIHNAEIYAFSHSVQCTEIRSFLPISLDPCLCVYMSSPRPLIIFETFLFSAILSQKSSTLTLLSSEPSYTPCSYLRSS